MSISALQKRMKIEETGVFDNKTLKAAMKFYRLTPERAAHFFGQCSHETGNFKTFVENLNYSAQGLLSVFGKYFTPQEAQQYQRNPEKIANRVYSNRIGNGEENSGDGWKFRGRGAIQLTGRDNYLGFANAVNNLKVMANPDIVANDYAFDSAIYFFNRNKLWAICDHGVNDAAILAITKKINGGTNGLEDRAEKTKLYYKWLKEEEMPKETMVSANFSLKDLTWSETAIRKGIKNIPNLEHFENLKAVAQNILEPVQISFKKRVVINSGYRGPTLNKLVGGSAKSQHCNGEAIDFEIDGIPNPQLARWIEKNLEFDQLILEFYNPKEGPNSGWVHCSYVRNGKNRKQTLTAVNVNGKTTYLPGFVT